MIIRAEQMNELQKDATTRFIDKLMAHFAALYPREVKELGNGYRRWIEDGVKEAASYGINTQQLGARFVNLWFVWGRDFETRPGFEWAAEVLESPRRSAFVKVHQLAHRTRIELDAIEADRLDQRYVA